MKLIFTLIFLLMCPTLASDDLLATGNFQFIEYKKYELQKSLPPQILLTFELPCNATFIKVIRTEYTEERSKQTIIALAGVIKENFLSSCANLTKEIKIPAGNAYSGRAYQIVKIKK